MHNSAPPSLADHKEGSCSSVMRHQPLNHFRFQKSSGGYAAVLAGSGEPTLQGHLEEGAEERAVYLSTAVLQHDSGAVLEVKLLQDFGPFPLTMSQDSSSERSFSMTAVRFWKSNSCRILDHFPSPCRRTPLLRFLSSSKSHFV
ncbi:hypothetical protein JZ751_003954 [Albula glossodonta]|uniref:Uncharacterized protein n=1 Tax=Albula glossodonta TaxID=121402 RepID=A0A8T2PGM0_9TELE|nr:hypothetical protein JZ751_003954 [Albula glossodonta]